MKYNSIDVCDEDELLITDKHVFFFGSVFSNFYPTDFEYSAFNETHRFFCTEQAFMWYKAKFFRDDMIADQILAEKSNPYVCKQLGRKVKNYDNAEWDKIRCSVMKAVNYCKFTQDIKLRNFMLDVKFDNKKFVEASPYDKIWGIKTAIGTPTIDDESTWKGKNLLGQCLTDVRRMILGAFQC